MSNETTREALRMMRALFVRSGSSVFHLTRDGGRISAALDAAAALPACGRFSSLRFNAATGALASLVDAATGHDWAAGAEACDAAGMGRLAVRIAARAS